MILSSCSSTPIKQSIPHYIITVIIASLPSSVLSESTPQSYSLPSSLIHKGTQLFESDMLRFGPGSQLPTGPASAAYGVVSLGAIFLVLGYLRRRRSLFSTSTSTATPAVPAEAEKLIQAYKCPLPVVNITSLAGFNYREMSPAKFRPFKPTYSLSMGASPPDALGAYIFFLFHLNSLDVGANNFVKQASNLAHPTISSCSIASTRQESPYGNVSFRRSPRK